jgi:hypothetical protein
MQNLPLDFAMLKDVAGRDSNMEADQRVKRGERTKWLALGDRESGLLGIGRSLAVFLTPTYSNSPGENHRGHGHFTKQQIQPEADGPISKAGR